VSIVGEEIRRLHDKVELELQRITETSLEERFLWLPNCPAIPQQYWLYELSIWEDDSNWHNLSCGLFTGVGRSNNPDLSIQTFFENNDHLLSIIENAVSTGAMNGLIPLLQTAMGLLSEQALQESIGGAAVSLHSYISSDDEWLKNVCNEYILILHLDENRRKELSVGCQQPERYRIKVPGSGGPMFLNVPFDKVELFEGHKRVEGYKNQPYFEYQVALSFAGEDRNYVARVANQLSAKKVRVFYDKYETASLWGKDLYTHLDEVYRKRARYCVVFVSENYRKKLWTNHERESAQARAFQENKEYLLPVRLDDTELPGIKPTIGYIHKKDVTVSQLADLIYKKIYGFGTQQG
jgi:hypothetical protein